VLLASELFHRAAHRRNRVAGPVELLTGTVRRLGARVAARTVAEAAAEMGQALFRPPSVKGWDGGRAWIDAGTWVARHNSLVALARAGVEDRAGLHVDLGALFGELGDRDALARRIEHVLLPAGLERERARLLRDAVREPDDDSAAAALGTALVLVSPDYQLG